jgi:hypothetical protein
VRPCATGSCVHAVLLRCCCSAPILLAACPVAKGSHPIKGECALACLAHARLFATRINLCVGSTYRRELLLQDFSSVSFFLSVSFCC